MAKPTTTTDMYFAVLAAIAEDDGETGDFDADAIVEEIHAEHGLTDIDELPSRYFWGVVAKHDKTGK